MTNYDDSLSPPKPTQGSEFLINPTNDNPVVNFLKYQNVKKKSLDKYLRQFTFLVTPLNDITDKVMNVKARRDSGQIMHSTLRAYKSALTFGLSAICFLHEREAHFDDLQGDILAYKAKLLKFSQVVDFATANALYQEVISWREDSTEQRNFLDNLSLSNNFSSAYKTKYFDEIIFAQLEQAVNEYGRQNLLNLYTFIAFNLKLGLRPIEWFSCSLVTLQPSQIDPEHLKAWQEIGIEPIDKKVWLKVKNGKHSFGRACGVYRYLALDDYGRDFIQDLYHFLVYLRDAYPTEKEWEQNLHNWRKQLARFLASDPVCQKIIQKNFKQLKKRAKSKQSDDKLLLQVKPTIYSTRHQAICDARASGLDGVSIAALFGHKDIDTARMHYGDVRRGSQGGFLAKPHADNIAIIYNKLNDRQKRSLIAEQQKYIKAEQSPTTPNNTQQLPTTSPAPTLGR